MKLFEFFNAEEIEGAYYDPDADRINKRIPNDTRKPIITLKILNRLKKIQALRRLENLKREDLLGIMYGGDGQDDMGMGGGLGGPPAF